MNVFIFLQISKLLVVHPKKRLTAEQALEHAWFKGAQVCDQLLITPYSINTLSRRVVMRTNSFINIENYSKKKRSGLKFDLCLL